MLKLKCVALVAVALAIFAGIASADTLPFTADVEASGISWQPARTVTITDYTGEAGSVFSGGVLYNARAAYHFDLTALPSYSAINSVTLALTRNTFAAGGNTAASMGVYRIADTYAGWAGTATWANSATGTPWNGGATMGTISAGSAVASTSVDPAAAAGTKFQWTITGANASALVNDWKTGTNSGLIIAAPDSTGPDSRTGFYMRTFGTESYRPTLIVDYTIPTPEPSTLVLTGIGLLGLLAYAWRRQK